MRTIKSYLAYAPTLYKIIVLILIPILLLAGSFFTFNLHGFPIGMYCFPIYVTVMSFADTWMLGGIHSKDYKGIALIQSSRDGLDYMKKVILADCIIKYVYLAVILFFSMFVTSLAGPKIKVTMLYFMAGFLTLLGGAVLSLLTTIIRFFGNMAATWLFSYVMGFACLLLLLLIEIAYAIPVISLLVAAGVAIFSGWLCVYIGTKKEEEKYHDARS